MKKWILPVCTLVLALGLGNAADGKAVTTQEKLQKQAEEQASYEAFSKKPMQLMEDAHEEPISADEEPIPASGNLPCENGNTISYTLENGVLTISGSGDKLIYDYEYFFNDNNDISKVVFTNDCAMTDLTNMFFRCQNLTAVENIPKTVITLNYAFSHTGLTSIPALPQNLTSMNYTFSGCSGITEVNWSNLPKTITYFSGAFTSTSVTTAEIVMNNSLITGTFHYAYCFSDCPLLQKLTVNAAGLNDDAGLWLQGICSGCTSLEQFELINIPATNPNPGTECASNMFNGCSSLKSVINEGYFDFSGEYMFNECGQLSSLQTKGFRDFYSDDALEYAFYNCRSLNGDYYISFSDVSELYDFASNLSDPDLEEYIGFSFSGCNNKTNFHLGYQELVNYWNQRKLLTESRSEANFLYWPEGDHYSAAPVITPPSTTTGQRPTVGNPPVTPTHPVINTVSPQAKKNIPVLKLTKYKKGTKKICGKTIGKATVKISIGKKTYKAKSNGKGNFTLKLKSKLKKKVSIKVTVSKSGYQTKSKTFKVK